MMLEPASKHPVLAVFASDKGPGDAERSSLMSQAGTHLARRGARIVCLAEGGVIPVPLITAARAAGGSVELVADGTIILPPALSGVTMNVLADKQERLAKLAQCVEAVVVLPGSLASATALFGVWAAARAQGRTLPVVMLNHHRAYEAIRGYAADVLSPGLAGYERSVQFSDSIEDLWNRVSRLVEENR